MTAKQLGEALDAANAHIADLTRDLNAARRDEAAVRAAERANATAADLERRCAKAESSNERHKEAVAKLTADNMVFLMRLKESEEESRAARAEADSMRGELEESRGAWFDKARKDVERVVERAMKRAEQSDAALEAELVAGEQRAEEWGAELAKMRAVLAQNATLARATEEATNALDDAVAARRDAERRAFDAANAQKAATAAMASASPSCFAVISALRCCSAVWRRRASPNSSAPPPGTPRRPPRVCADSERASDACSALV